MSPIRTLDKSETDWLHTKIEEGRFVGNGGPFNLEQIIREFLRLIEGKKAA
jgi:hypothetical protein